MEIITFLFVGFFVGWLASVLVKRQGSGIGLNIVIGIIGAFFGGFLFNVFNVTAYGFFGSFVMSVIGAVVFLLIVRLFQRNTFKQI